MCSFKTWPIVSSVKNFNWFIFSHSPSPVLCDKDLHMLLPSYRFQIFQVSYNPSFSHSPSDLCQNYLKLCVRLVSTVFFSVITVNTSRGNLKLCILNCFWMLVTFVGIICINVVYVHYFFWRSITAPIMCLWVTNISQHIYSKIF